MDRIILKNKELTVSLLYPGSVYKRSRFDWTGIVEQVSIGDINFLGREEDGNYKGSEGIGLCSEFDMRSPGSYWKTKPGGDFMKIGVGNLKRKSLRPYSFFHDYDVKAYTTDIQVKEEKVLFRQNNGSAGLYGCDYKKTISIKDNSLTIDYKLKNTGKRNIKTEEYCHNFLRPGDSEITDSVLIDISHPLKYRKKVGDLLLREKSMGFTKNPEAVYYTNSLLKEKPGDFSWRILNTSNGASIVGRENFPVSKFALWGMKHVISPETFYSFTIKPGEEQIWSRHYTFSVQV